MKFITCRILQTTKEHLQNYLKEALEKDYRKSDAFYENESPDMTIIAFEKYYFGSNSTQMNMVILKKDVPNVLVDIMGGAGGTGLMNINSWGTEKKFVKKVRVIVEQYCKEHYLELEEVKGF